MHDFDLQTFDAKLLINLVEHGIDITKFNITTEVAWVPERENPILRGSVTPHVYNENSDGIYFAYQIDDDADEDTYARKIAWRIRDNFQPWRINCPEFIEDYLDQKEQDGKYA